MKSQLPHEGDITLNMPCQDAFTSHTTTKEGNLPLTVNVKYVYGTRKGAILNQMTAVYNSKVYIFSECTLDNTKGQ